MPFSNLASENPQDWESLHLAWARFAEANPDFGFAGSRFASSRLTKRYYGQLASAGVMVRTIQGRYLVHKEKFPKELFRILIGTNPE